MRSVLTTVAADGSDPHIILDAPWHLEAPNWTPDGRWLIVNADGGLYRVDAFGRGETTRIEAQGLPPVNNDHVVSPNGDRIFASANDGHIYAVPVGGGAARRVTNQSPGAGQRFHFLHGISPDGETLAYVVLIRAGTWSHQGIWLLSVEVGTETQILSGVPPKDGPEFSPDGRWLYFNGDVSVDEPGHSQLFRWRVDDGVIEQLTEDDRVNWFPHQSPDGQHLVYLSYPAGTQGHPGGRDVIVRVADAECRTSADVAAIRGGQGTINVNSWAPDSQRFAYVAYPA
jgi:TolB protein